MTDAQEKLIEDNLNIAYYTVQKYGQYKDDEEIGVAEETLVIAALNFDETKGVKFSTYAVSCIRLRIIMFNSGKRHLISFRKKGKVCYEPTSSLDSGYFNNGIEDIKLIDILTNKEGENEENVIEHLYANEFFDKLSERERTILKLRMLGKSQKEIAEAVGLSQGFISRLIIKLRNQYLNAEG